MIVTLFGGIAVAGGKEREEALLSATLRRAARAERGFISMKTYRADDGEEVGVIRFDSREALERWIRHEDHWDAIQRDDPVYDSFWIQSAETFREYLWERGDRVTTDLTPFFSSEADREPTQSG